MSDSTWLESLKPGDEVVYEGGYSVLSLATVQGVAQAYVTVSGLKFRRDSGRSASGGFHGARILEATPERRRLIARKALTYRLRDVKWEDYGDATLEAVAALVWPSDKEES